MKRNLISKIHCPKCTSSLVIQDAIERNGEIWSGILRCVENNCASIYPVRNYIPRFVPADNYSASWGDLWINTGKTIRDSYTSDTFYHDVLFGKWSEDNIGRSGANPFGFEWPKKMEGQVVLEIGTGVGVCTEHLVTTGAEIISVDMSGAVDSLPEPLLINPNLNVIQADIMSGVFLDNQFDRIWMFQVLQHTPDPVATLRTIRPLLRPGGEISFTSYHNKFYPWYHAFTKRMSFRQVYWMVRILLPVKTRLQRFFEASNMPLFAKTVRKLMEPVDPRDVYYGTLVGRYNDYPSGKLYGNAKDKRVLFWLAFLNTFDTITPVYTNGGSNEEVYEWTKAAGYQSIRVWGRGGARVKAIRSVE